jgi:hypothetical protein
MKCKSVAREQTHFKSAFSDLPENDATSEKLEPVADELLFLQPQGMKHTYILSPS